MVKLSGCDHFNPIKINITSNGRQDLKGEEVSQCAYAVLGNCSLAVAQRGEKSWNTWKVALTKYDD